MIEETKVNENTEFDTYDGKEDSPKLKLTDKKVESGFGEYGEENGLSPNPDGSGYVKQINATAKPENPEENVLYVINDVKWKWTVEEGWLRVFENPSLKTIDGGRGTPTNEVTRPKVRPRVFSEPVAFQDDVFVKGKLLGVEFKQIAVGQYRSDVIVDPGSGRTNYGINFLPQEWVEFDNWGNPTQEEIAQLQKAMADFKQKIKNANLIIFTMNNTFVITPVAQNGDTLMLGNFAYDSQGNSTVARLRLKFHDEGVAVLFDDDFGEAMQIAPYGALLVVNF